MLIPASFEKQSFLQAGALFRDSKNKLHLFWGQTNRQPFDFGKAGVNVWDYFSESSDWLEFEHHMSINPEEILPLCQSQSLCWSWRPPSRERFDRQMDVFRRMRAEQKLTKLVPYGFETAQHELTERDLESLLSAVLQSSKGFVYGVWNAEGGVLGLSPETLVEQSSPQVFKTAAVAGTRPLDVYRSHPQDLTEDPKEIFEHEEVVKSLEEKLKKWGDVRKGERDVIETPQLAHLHTAFELHARSDFSVDKLVQDLHPTPALGCAPTEAWRDVMKELDDIEPRGAFGAPFGFRSPEGWAHYVVAIRNLIWSAGEVRIGAGCGFVEASDPNREWQELTQKRESVKKVFGLQ